MESIIAEENATSAKCANCLQAFTGELPRIINITGKHDKKTIPVIQAISLIYGFPLERQLPRQRDGMLWSKEDECGLCGNCAKVVTLFYHAFQELQMLTRETSYIFRGISQFHKCIQKHFLHDNAEEPEVSQRREGTVFNDKHLKNAKRRGCNRTFSIKNSVTHELNTSVDEEELPTLFQENANNSNVIVASLVKTKDANEYEEDLDNELNLEIVKVETLLPEPVVDTNTSSNATTINKPVKRKRIKKENVSCEIQNEEVPVTGSMEIVSADGKVIRTSTRVRKAKKPLDLDETSGKALKLKGNPGRSIPASVPTSSDSDTDLMNICNEMYYNEANLVKLPDGKYICPEVKCAKAFKGLKTLNKHALAHDLDRPYRCSKCDLNAAKVFPNRQEIKTHLKTIHVPTNIIKTENQPQIPRKRQPKISGENSSKRPSPSKLRKKYTKAKTNAQTSSTEKPYKCEHCDKQFLLKSVYDKHLSSHEKQTALCRCNVCDQTFPTVMGLARHITNVHDDEVKEKSESKANTEDASGLANPLKCEQCNKTFKKRYQFNMHVLFHNDLQPRFGCSQCPKLFFQPGTLRTHLLVHNQENPLLCSQCDKVFERRDHFKRHMEVVHNQNKEKSQRKRRSASSAQGENDAEPHTCSECKKTFTRKEYLRLHMRIHTGEKPHICPTCGKQFRDPRNLVQHLVTHTSDRPFCCSVCGLTFKRAHHLNDHESTHRQNIVRPFVCPVAHCGKAFKLRKHLVSHELVHSGKKEETCHVCGRSFSRKDNLRQHINKIHGKKQAEELLAVVEEQRERFRKSQLEQEQQHSLSSSSSSPSLAIVEDAETPSEQDAVTTVVPVVETTTTTVVPSISITPKTTRVVVARSTAMAGTLVPGTSGQVSQVLQIIPAQVVTTLEVPVTSIVAKFPTFPQ